MPPVASVLIVDDEPAVRDLMSRWVSSLGLRPQTASNAVEALATLRTHHCDLAVIDVMMPGQDGLWLANELRRDYPHTAVVIATAYTQLLDSDGQPPPIADYLIKPFERERFALAVDRGRQWRRQALEEVTWHAALAVEARERAAQVCAVVRGRFEAGEEECQVLVGLAKQRMPDTWSHSERVARYAESVARQLDVTGALGRDIGIAARLHDIGKIAMPDALLTKPSPLTAGEMAIMRQHVELGADILEATTTLTHAAPTVRASHEWFGGGGYPRGTSSAAIPLTSRIIAVADAYDAMTQDRVYRIRFDSSDAVAELLRCSPSQFDPEVLTAFLAVLARH